MLAFVFCLLSASQAHYWEDDYYYEEVDFEEDDDQYILDTFGKCDICKMLVRAAEEAGYSKKSDLTNYLNSKVCGKLGIVKGLCEGLVSTIVDKAWEMIQKKIDPAVVCKSIRMC
ncbi:hypothetical protein BLNAU_1036 [Blattamonas nauphoetae]|uniref:Saposin B-type domain-containing protein n=1 Tax=Blattamonas nauphoetae TaxID=2049346 RepID=A0ABQ9YJM1_9EUKA|nr:hypothetical protein BLNAU_1036 [Blattamonas nauphoetae]